MCVMSVLYRHNVGIIYRNNIGITWVLYGYYMGVIWVLYGYYIGIVNHRATKLQYSRFDSSA